MPTSNDTSDEALMAEVAEGSLTAFEALSRRYHARLARYCAKMTGELDQGADLAQEILFQVWRTKQRYQRSAPFDAFLFTMARNTCSNARRSTARRHLRVVPSATGDLGERADSGPLPLDAIARVQEAAEVRAALVELPEAQREAVLLRFDQGLDYATIAQLVGRNESTVRSQVFHGLKRLKALLFAGDAP